MKYIGIVLISCLSGIFAGMGMGGGTFLIPALSLLFGINQAICQSTNVICFIVLGVICFFIYKHDNLINFKILFLVSIPACIISGIFTFFSIKISSIVLKTCFSVFIIVFGVIYFIQSMLNLIGQHKKNSNNNKFY